MSSTNSRFVQDLNRIVRVQQPNQTSMAAVEAEPIAAVRGVGDVTQHKTQSGGIASPLKEIPGTREYHEPELITSSDGLFVMEQKSIKRAVYLDANGDQVVIEFERDKHDNLPK